MDPIPQGALELACNTLPFWNSHLQASTKAKPTFKIELQEKRLRKTIDPEVNSFLLNHWKRLFATVAEIASLEPKMCAECGLSHCARYTLQSRDGVFLSTLQASVYEAPT